MDERENNCKALPFIVFGICGLMAFSLVFSESVWFDEAYTLALIKHDFAEISAILAKDMHPPLYFLTLKTFCSVFGYSLICTKIFSFIGWLSTLVLGITVIRRRYGESASVIYQLSFVALPYSLYFCAQQRAYTWCMFFVTLTALYALYFIKNGKTSSALLLSISAAFASYNHFYAALSAGLMLAYVSVYALLTKKRFLSILFSDLLFVALLLPYSITLIGQVKNAVSDFWLSGIEPLSVVIFGISAAIVALSLYFKELRRVEFYFLYYAILSLQVVGLVVTLCLRPFYIARYFAVEFGVVALLFALAFSQYDKYLKNVAKRVVPICLAVLVAFGFAFNVSFEYDRSAASVAEEMKAAQGDNFTFVYADTSFGVVERLFPKSRHLTLNYKDWYDAFDYLEKINPDGVIGLASDNGVYFVKEKQKKLPKFISEKLDFRVIYSFRVDFNEFEVLYLSCKK